MVIRAKNADGGTEKHRTLMTFAATESGKKVLTMAEYIEREDASTDICDHNNKIKTNFAKIIVNSTGKPYYNILYFDRAKRIYRIGFGSYKLSYVRKWLAEEFEVDDGAAADVAPVRDGRWMCHGDCGVTECSVCGWSIEEYVGDYAYCPNCGAKMDGGADDGC